MRSALTAPSASPSRAACVGVSLLVGTIWALTYVLALASPDAVNPVSLVDYLAVVHFSALLAILAPAAWLIARMAGPSRAVAATAGITGVGGLIAAIGNVIEDGLRAKGVGGLIFVCGLGGLLLGLIGLAVVLALRRQALLAVLALVTFAGLFSSANGGAFLIPLGWLAFAAWVWGRRTPGPDKASAEARRERPGPRSDV